MILYTPKPYLCFRLPSLLAIIVGYLILCPAENHAVSVPQKQIQISARIYEYRLDTDKQLGLFYQYNRTKGSIQTSDVFLHGSDNVQQSAIPAVDLSGSFAQLEYGSIDYNLKTAIEMGQATIIANPSLMITEGKTGNLHGGEEVPITRVTIQNGSPSLNQSKENVGITLDVTPYIYKDKYILMKLKLNASEILRMDVFDRGDFQRYELPVVSTKNIDLTVLVPSGEMLYIGGLFSDTSSNVVRKVPILGDLPVIGYFLRGINKKKSRFETVFQITPTIKMHGQGLDQDLTFFQDLLEPLNKKGKGKGKEKKPSTPQAPDASPADVAPANVSSATDSQPEPQIEQEPSTKALPAPAEPKRKSFLNRKRGSKGVPRRS